MAKDIVPAQLKFDVVASTDINGIEMGVLGDGTAFLTGRGMAALAGVAPSLINTWGNSYDPLSGSRRDRAIEKLLGEMNYDGPPFVKVRFDGRDVNAFPEQVCMALLEYYAFEAGARTTDRAFANYRLLARAGLRVFVYSSLGYDPTQAIPQAFKEWHTRLELNPAPQGYFSVFTQMNHMMLAAIRAGLPCDSHTVPDVSVGQAWAKFYRSTGLENEFGESMQHEHRYPPGYPQARANGFITAAIYPMKALGEFMDWLDRTYLPQSYPHYIKTKVRKKDIPPSVGELIIEAVVPKELGTGNDD